MKERQKLEGARGKGDDDEEAALARLLEADDSPWRVAAWRTAIRGATPCVHRARRLRVGRGRELATITAALELAACGDVIEIGAGTYHEALCPEIDVELVGAGARKVTIESDAEHPLFVDGVGVLARGIRWSSARDHRAAVCARDGGILRMERCAVRSATDGVSVCDPGTMACARGGRRRRPLRRQPAGCSGS